VSQELHSGNKYHRRIASVENINEFTTVDVYSVLEAFKVTCPARQHAIKKLLCSGIRGKGDAIQDLKEARDAILRAIELETQRQGNAPVPVK
jgi:hypothetical protein